MERKFTLRQWRKVADMSIAELAKEVGKSDKTIQNWEQGITQPNATDIAKLEQVLNINWSSDILLP